MFSLAAAYAIAVASRVKNLDVKRFVVKTACLWGVAGLLLGILMYFWFLKTLPDVPSYLYADYIPQGLKIGAVVSGALAILYFIIQRIKSASVGLYLPIVVIIISGNKS